MGRKIIDSHIHFDLYHERERRQILQELGEHNVKALISVSNHLQSAKINLQFSRKDNRIKPAFGYHPEQTIPTDNEIADLQRFVQQHHKDMVAIGEVGLPFYLRKDDTRIPLEPYVELLESFIRQAVVLNKPIILHAIYEDAPLVCDLLEKHSVKQAHFHWFKGDQKTVERLKRNGYYISVTPDVLYEGEIQQLVQEYPLSKMMVETDGPWGFEGIFENQMTHPKMIHHSIRKIAELKNVSIDDAYWRMFENTCGFYGI